MSNPLRTPADYELFVYWTPRLHGMFPRHQTPPHPGAGYEFFPA